MALKTSLSKPPPPPKNINTDNDGDVGDVGGQKFITPSSDKSKVPKGKSTPVAGREKQKPETVTPSSGKSTVHSSTPSNRAKRDAGSVAGPSPTLLVRSLHNVAFVVVLFLCLHAIGSGPDCKRPPTAAALFSLDEAGTFGLTAD